MSYPHQLFTVEEAFVRLGDVREQGCLLSFNHYESAHIFVEDGFVICAISSGTHGEAALSYALHMDNSSYVWMRGVTPTIRNMAVEIRDYILKHSSHR